MPLDKHNSRIARAMDLLFSLTNVTLSRDVPIYQPQQLNSSHHGATFVPLCAPILFSQPHKVTICGRHVMALVGDIKITEALLLITICYETSSHC